MSLSQKILIGLFAILLLVVAVEAGVFWGYQSAPPSTTRFITASEGQKKQTVLDDYFVNNVPRDIRIFLLKLGILSLKKTATSSTFIIAYEGKITQIDRKGGLFGVDKYAYKIKFEIKGKDDDSVIAVYSESEIPLLKVFAVVKDKPEAYNFDEIKVGDMVKLEEIYDVKNKRLVEANVTKINL